MNLGFTNIADEGVGGRGGGEMGAISLLSIGLFDGLNEYVKMLVGLACCSLP